MKKEKQKTNCSFQRIQKDSETKLYFIILILDNFNASFNAVIVNIFDVYSNALSIKQKHQKKYECLSI